MNTVNIKIDLTNDYCFESLNCSIEPRKAITISGIYKNRIDGPIAFNKTFKVGDVAVYGSYNLIYTGIITAIGEKTVTIQHYKNSTDKSRLNLYRFSWRNWDFDHDRIEAYNVESLGYI